MAFHSAGEQPLPKKPEKVGKPGPVSLARQWILKSGSGFLSFGFARRGSQMAKNIYVGNLSWECTADDLLALFQEHGNVARAQVITDRETGRSRGFGFVEMD